MSNIIEIESKCEAAENTVVNCGPMYAMGVTAEMQIMDGEDKIFLTAQWNNDFEDGLLFSSNKESIYDYTLMKKQIDKNYERILNNNLEMIDDMKEMKNSKYHKQYKKLALMVISKMIDESTDIVVRF